MKTIKVILGNEERIFRTNNSGSYLFVDYLGSNKQISCESGFHNPMKIKKHISYYMHSHFPEIKEKIKYEMKSYWN